ncbi:hypothetical protein E2C01_072757 [Portunus trituberculatus]|uniref:Uncharacterized protein n=1 Tax=Portunus trituberculatus TaxID=210409 RepID=A0A5B7I3F6_PORTR|nr:hypothetical protein [Portunus trituberculatus]
MEIEKKKLYWRVLDMRLKKCYLWEKGGEKLDIIAKVEAGEELREVGRFSSINESTVLNVVKC